ncbi:MAG TPA: pyridoxamine 5'-phosphate oxidase family protein [Thermoanaerobaculia bacterium]|nr:pyridoxamine 5'-phosphate oxidase family protein [Thermoanaerobaculia bacterium]
MGKNYDRIDDSLAGFIRAQQMFFVATAPLSAEGSINVSPKGLDTFRILDEHTVAYLDLTGSGIETVAHLRENGRIVVMFCAFEGRPMILRLHGRGVVHQEGTDGFARLRDSFPPLEGARAIVEIAVERIADSCGWSVPRYAFHEDRDQLLRYYQQKGEDAVRAGRVEWNRQSIDGLPGLGEPDA